MNWSQNEGVEPFSVCHIGPTSILLISTIKANWFYLYCFVMASLLCGRRDTLAQDFTVAAEAFPLPTSGASPPVSGCTTKGNRNIKPQPWWWEKRSDMASICTHFEVTLCNQSLSFSVFFFRSNQPVHHCSLTNRVLAEVTLVEFIATLIVSLFCPTE